MRYCGEKTCRNDLGQWVDGQDYCADCGTELTPYVECVCGGMGRYNPKRLPKFTPCCGIQLTEDVLAQSMSKQLKTMVAGIVAKHDALNA